MRDIKKIILLIIITLIIIVMLVLALKLVKREILDEVELSEQSIFNPNSPENVLQEVKYKSDFYSVKNCIEKLYSYYGDFFDPEVEDSSESQKAVYDLLDDKYKDYKGITQNNIKEKINTINVSKVNINEMYVNQKSSNIYVYVVRGTLRKLKSTDLSDFELIVMQDTSKQTFSVFLSDYIQEYHKQIELGRQLQIDVPEKIEENDYNKYDYEIIDEDTYIQDLMQKYKEEMMFDTESAYNHLDSEYREKRFGSLSDFQAYAKENMFNTVTLQVDSYRKTTYDEYVEYVCMDTKGKYYIIKAKSVLNYGMILDTYTVDFPDFVEKYNNSKEEQKAALNADKVIAAINDKDYKYIYNKLNTTYKNTYFSNFNTFVEYIKNNFYTANDMNVEKIESAGQNTYTMKLKISNSDNTQETKNATIIVRVLEDRNFEMSFAR